MIAALLVTTIAAGAAAYAAPAPSTRAFGSSLRAGGPAAQNACELLAPEEIRMVQSVPVKERKSSEHTRQGLRFAQCVFATSDFAHSVSLSVITGSQPDAARSYWTRTFHPKMAEGGRKKPPRAVAGQWDEGLWSGDARAGSLYVLSNGIVLRVSVGGVADEEERLRRTKTLVEAALRRLRQS